MSEILRARHEARGIIRRFGITKPPVDVEDVVRRLGIQLITEPLDDELSGMAVRSSKHKLIIANSRHHLNRRRFTIAHECGHHVLHESYLLEGVHVDKGILRRDSLSSSGRDLKEVAANAFAAELLMPRNLISSIVPRDFDVLAEEEQQELKEVAERFGVSTAALSIRLINLS